MTHFHTITMQDRVVMNLLLTSEGLFDAAILA